MNPLIQYSEANGSPGELLVSIIVPTFNRARFLERCVRSILDQTYRQLECWVIDGGSTDGSIQLLKRLAEEDSRLKFLSEPDHGEVDAVNKGLDLAKGAVVGFQASDDYYVLDAVEKSVAFLLEHPDLIGVGGDGLYVNDTGQEVDRGVITYRGRMDSSQIKHIIKVRYKTCLICHGSFFGWRKRLLKHGKLDCTFSVIPDWEYYLRLLAEGEHLGCLPRVQYKYTLHSEMGAARYYHKVEAQRRDLLKIYGLRWYDKLYRSTLGRWKCYVANPYRSHFFPGLVREIREWWAHHLL